MTGTLRAFAGDGEDEARVPSIRKRQQFAATLLSDRGQPLTECYVLADVETTVQGAQRRVTWRGKITSLSAPQHAYHGRYQLRPQGAEAAARIEVTRGAGERLGITSDEYDFLGAGAPPELP